MIHDIPRLDDLPISGSGSPHVASLIFVRVMGIKLQLPHHSPQLYDLGIRLFARFITVFIRRIYRKI